MLSYDSSSLPIKAARAPASIPLPASLQATPTAPSPLSAQPSSLDSLNSAAANGHGAKDQQHIWLVTGPAGCGKSTIAEYLANTLNMPYIEGDSVRVNSPARGVPHQYHH